MAEEQSDSLKGWAILKKDLFSESERPNLHFMVAWNEPEAKFAVTCHNRTLQQQQQRQRRRRREDPGPAPGEGGAPAEGEEEEEAETCGPLSWAGLFSAAELEGVHRQLAAVSLQLEDWFPALSPEAGSSLWALLFPAAEPDEEALEQQCRQLERYLEAAIDMCGTRMVLDSLFPDDSQPVEEYFENLQEFQKKTLQEHVVRAREQLFRIVHGHENAIKMIDLMKVYEEEDEAYKELVTVATNFYEYLLQPFRDMRELATLYKLKISKSLEFDELGPKRIEEMQKEARGWTRQADEAVTSIQDITVNYFKETANALTEMKKHMELDEKRFGQAAWAFAAPRLEKLKYMLARETLQYKRAKELCLNRKRVEIKKKVEHLSEAERNIDMIDELEMQYYEVQLELYDVQLEILKFKEMLLITELDATKRLIKVKQDEPLYYDTVETLEELADHPAGQKDPQVSEMEMLEQKSQQLESKRLLICARRAYLRNKKDQCKENHNHKLQQAQENIKRFYQHHNIQMKRDQRKEEEKEKQEWISQERQKTLQRLKSFKEKCPAQFVLKTSHSKPISPKLPKDISQKISSPASQPLSIVPSSSKHTRSTHSSKVRSLKISKHKNSPENIPSKILVPFGDLPHSETSRELTSPSAPIPLAAPPPPSPPSSSPPPSPPPLPPPPPPPPPLPPPPLPPPPLPSSPLSLRTSGRDDDQLLPLVCVSTAERYDSSKSSLNLCTGTMDKVLASLKHGALLRHKVEKSSLPTSETSVRGNILAAIKQGVKLKKVQEPITDISKESSSELEKSIKAALQRIQRVTADSEEDDSEDQNNTEWDI